MPKAILVKEVFDFLSRYAPTALAEEWDNVGLQVGRMREKVRGILVSLDVTGEVLQEAEKKKANLLITHHPLFFRPLKKMDDSTVSMRLTREAIERKINVLSFHTNLDSTREGLNDLLARTLKLQRLKPLIPSKTSSKAGLGRVGHFKETSLKVFTAFVARVLSLKNFRYVGEPDHPIRTVAVMTGSGGDFFREAKKAGADVLVTGDVKYHAALDALAEGIAVIDIGHFAGEIGMIHLVAEKLRGWFLQKRISLNIFESKVQEDPFQFWNKT